VVLDIREHGPDFLGLIAAVSRTIRDEGGRTPTTAPMMDELLDERLAGCSSCQVIRCAWGIVAGG
jgi:hypothetical protein